MSSRADRRQRRWARGTDDGFTLVEVLVALLVVGVLAGSLLPLLATTVKATTRVRLETQAKNLAQQRVETMRNLAFHVDRQNGPFVDLLDIYYTNVSTAPTTRSDGSVGQWLAEAGGANGAPSGPAYLLRIPSLPGHPDFNQDVYAQFLRTTRTLSPVPTTYDSQAIGADLPPSQLLGVTVITRYQTGTERKVLRTYTEMADGDGADSLLTTQARAQALQVTSTSDTAVTLRAGIGIVNADGSVTTGSAASVQAEGARIENLGSTPQTGASVTAVAPPNPSGYSGTGTSSSPGIATGSGTCGWASFGQSRADDVSATTTNGLPRIPVNAGPDLSAVGSGRVRAGLLRNGSGCTGYSFGYRNSVATPVYDPQYELDAGKPVVGVRDATGGQLSTYGSVAITADTVGSSTGPASAHSSAVTDYVRLLPTTSAPDGLVVLRLTQASVSCVAGAAPVASYTLEVSYPGNSTTVTFSTSSATVPALPDPATIVVATSTHGTKRLSDYLSWEVATAVTSAASGASTIGPVVRVVVPAAVTGNGGFTLELGKLSCHAEDVR